MLAEVHDQVAGLLGGPFPGWMQRDSQDANAPAGVLDHGQDVRPILIEQVRREEITCQDRLGLGAQEQRPGRPSPPRRGIDAGLLQDLPYRRRRDSYPKPGQFPVDPAVAPAGVLAGQPQDQGPDVPAGGRAAGLAAHGPAAQQRPTISRCQRKMVSGLTSSRSPCRWALGITASRVARSARSAQSLGRRGCRRFRTASWWRRIKISAVFHVSSRRASRRPARRG